MSQENVEIVRKAWQVYVDDGIDAASAYFADDCILDDFGELADGATYVGAKGVRERYRHFAGVWGDFRLKPLEFIDGGGDVVVAVSTMVGQPQGSVVPLEAPAVFVYQVRDGEIVRDRPFTSRTEALKAVGLEE